MIFEAWELIPGDQVQAYDYRNMRPVFATILEKNLGPQLKRVQLEITKFKTIEWTHETVGLTSTGEKTLKDGVRQFLGYCNHNPKNLVPRDIQSTIEYNALIDTVELVWETPDYLWVEGILCGTSKETN
jgi:hypothetical protein